MANDKGNLCVENITEQLEKSGILLSGYGNHNGDLSGCTPDEYWDMKKTDTLFKERELFIAKHAIGMVFEKSGQWSQENSYTMRHFAEDWAMKNFKDSCYVSNGAFIMGMILCGFQYKFKLASSQKPEISARFKCKLI